LSEIFFEKTFPFQDIRVLCKMDYLVYARARVYQDYLLLLLLLLFNIDYYYYLIRKKKNFINWDNNNKYTQ